MEPDDPCYYLSIRWTGGRLRQPAIAYSNGDARPNQYAGTDSYGHGYRNRYSHTHSYTVPHRHTDANPHQYAYTDQYPNLATRASSG